MAAHKGWIVTFNRGAWLARAWDPLRQTYISKRFAPPYDKGQATDWAKAEAADYALLAREQLPQDAGVLTTTQLAEAYLKDLRRRRRSPVHLADVAQMLDRYARAVPDLSARTALTDTEEWLETLTRAPRGAQTPQREGHTGAGNTEAPALAPATVNKYLTVIRAMAAWGKRRRYLLRDPLEPIERVAVPKPIKAQFTVAELKRLVGAVDHPYHPRFCLMLYAGLRVQEAHHLQWESIDFEGRMIAVVQGDYALKGDKERLVPLQAELALVLGLMPRRSDGFLFEPAICNLQGPQHGRHLARFCADVGVTIGDRTPHSLRHCYAGLMTATAVPSLLLAAYMGHSTTQTTAGYTELATRYLAPSSSWRRGEFELLAGARCPWPRSG